MAPNLPENGDPIAIISFTFDPKKGVNVARQGNFPAPLLVMALEMEKALIVQQTLPSSGM